MGLTALVISDTVIHAFTSELSVVLAAVVGAVLPSPSPAAPMGKVATLSLLHFRLVCGVVVDGYLPTIWEAFYKWRGRMEVMTTLNQTVLRGLPSCFRLLLGRFQLSASFPLIAFVKNISLLDPSLDPACIGWGGGSRPG